MTPAPWFEEASRHIRRRDAVMGGIMARVGPCTLRPSRSYFRTLVQAVVWQQLSWKAACSIYARVLDALGTSRPGPDDILHAPRRLLVNAGLSRQKYGYLVGLAEHFAAGRFPARRIVSMGDDEIIAELTALRGIGRWSAEMFLIFGLNRPDVFPAGDLGLRKVLARLYAGCDEVTPEALEAITHPWRPYRTLGTWYAWASIDGAPMRTPGRE